MVSDKDGTSTRVRYVTMAVQLIYGRSSERINASVLGRGLRLKDENGLEWELNQLLFADDAVFVADSEEKLQRSVTEFSKSL